MNKKGHVLNAVLLAVGLGFVLEPVGDIRTFETVGAVFVPVVLGALFPDVDTAFGTHRKTLHNVPVLLVIGAYPLVFGNLHFVWVGVLSHYLLDVLGSKRGIALFYPLSEREYGLPIGVSTSDRWADTMTLAITAFELVAAFGILYLLPIAVLSPVASLLGI